VINPATAFVTLRPPKKSTLSPSCASWIWASAVSQNLNAVAELRVLDLGQCGLAELERLLEARYELFLGVRPRELVRIRLLHAGRRAAEIVVPFLNQMGDHVPEAHLGGRGFIAVLVGRHLLRGFDDVLRLALRHGANSVRDRVLGLRRNDREGEGADGNQGSSERGSHP